MPSIEELQREYMRRAKRIDQRMRVLEQKGRTQMGYRAASREYKELFGEGRPRFEKKFKGFKNKQKLQAAINALDRIEHMESTTSRGLHRITTKAAATLERKTGLEIEPNKLGSFFESGMYKKLLSDGYASDTIVRGIAKMRRDAEKIQKALDNWGEYHVHGNYRNDTVRKFIEEQVNEKGFNLDDLFKGLGF